MGSISGIKKTLDSTNNLYKSSMHRAVLISLVLVISLIKMTCSLYVFSPPDLPHDDQVSSSPSSSSALLEDHSVSSYTGLPPAYDFSAVLYSLSQMDDDVKSI